MFIGFNLPQAVGDLALFLEVLGPGVKMQALHAAHRCPIILAEHRIAMHCCPCSMPLASPSSLATA